MTIVVSTADGGTTKVEESGVESEAFLQRYISDNPEVLPLDQYKEGTQLLILARELPTRSGAIDALGVDQDGEIYVIETKLYENPDKRRVLAQVLDYGASLWRTYPDPTELIGRLRDSAEERFGVDLGDQLRESFGLGEPEIEEFFAALRTNITAGNLRFVVLMDRIGDRLKDLIIFVNQNSTFDVFGVELQFYRHGEMRILVPELYGAEVKKNVGRGGTSSRGSWDRKTFFEDAEDRLRSEQLDAVGELYSWADRHADRISWGTGTRRGSFNPKFDRVHPSKSVFTVYSDGELVLRFGWLSEDGAGNPRAERFGRALRERLPDVPVPAEFMSEHTRVPIEVWAPKASELTDILAETVASGGQ